MSIQKLNLNKDFSIENGGHILYFFTDKLSYIENLLAYVTDGIKQGHNVIIIDETDVYEAVNQRLLSMYSIEDLRYIFFEECGVYYGIQTDFDGAVIAERFENILQSLPTNNRTVQTWARVDWRDQQGIISKLERFEKDGDRGVKDNQMISLCAYDSTQTPSELLIRLLKNHDYFMTDTELIVSPLYKENGLVFPSLSTQSKIDSELDFYKSKLDFVHVVSHEVRNPLTVISGFVNILRNIERNLSSDGLEKLIAIDQYVKSIDQELTHIIETEQMLSTELYMKLEQIYPFNTVQQVIELMKTKSFVENVTLEIRTDFSIDYSILGNYMGLKLILSNLIGNAIKYSGEQGRVEFSASSHKNQIRFVIKDNGIGMTSGQLESLFKKYGKLNENKSGQGIGLYVVKNLVDRFNGSIHFESELGNGTEVTLDFPILS